VPRVGAQGWDRGDGDGLGGVCGDLCWVLRSDVHPTSVGSKVTQCSESVEGALTRCPPCCGLELETGDGPQAGDFIRLWASPL